MSIRTTITCDDCNEEEEIDMQYIGRIDAADLPDGWIEDPDDDEQHLCNHCAVDKGLVQAPPPAEHVMVTHYWRNAPAGFIFHCQYCRAEIWQRDYYYTTPKTCNVCNHLNGPKLLTGGHE